MTLGFISLLITTVYTNLRIINSKCRNCALWLQKCVKTCSVNIIKLKHVCQLHHILEGEHTHFSVGPRSSEYYWKSTGCVLAHKRPIHSVILPIVDQQKAMLDLRNTEHKIRSNQGRVISKLSDWKCSFEEQNRQYPSCLWIYVLEHCSLNFNVNLWSSMTAAAGEPSLQLNLDFWLALLNPCH